ncbi:ATPase/histidine kinase/DNA gyrase B/HSP90 domain protein [Umbribacter vaginalis]|nr:ATPase/histidine kinase/DNA gyrase B/HSP90 domain protein [Coriobacteriales bacterium DNF00809]CRH64462.1 Sensor histidine kinase YycG [Chlamydia trachomatis]
MKISSEHTLIHKELLRSTAVFFVVFALLLSVLGVFIYHQVHTVLFRETDAQLVQARENIQHDVELLAAEGSDMVLFRDATNEQGVGAHSNLSSEQGEGTLYNNNRGAAKKRKRQQRRNSGIHHAFEQDLLFTSIIRATEHAIQSNSRLLFVVRDSSGAVLNAISLYTVFPEYVTQLPLNSDAQAKPYSLACDGHFMRGVTITFPRDNDDVSYVQVLANVDSEMAILESVTNTLIGGFLVALIIAAALSYILARRALKPLLQSWVKQTEFIQNASHELRTPLTIIKTTQELLLDKPNDKVIDHFENIAATIEEVDRLSHLSADLLFLTKFDSGAHTLNKTKIELDGALRFMAHLYRETVELQDKVFQFSAASNCSIMADEKKIRQLIAIVLDNALKYTHEGDRIQMNSFREGHDAVIEVKDTGIGISKEDAKRAFERFYRADKARSEGGSGLGLAIAFSIVKAHGGKITIAPWTAPVGEGVGTGADVGGSVRGSVDVGGNVRTGVCDGEVSDVCAGVHESTGQTSNEHVFSSSGTSEQSSQFQSGTCVRISFPSA